MTVEELTMKTPRYVLLNNKQRMAPQLLAQPGGPKYEAIYGFSTKQSYELFIANSDLPLTPYPLVKRYLRERMAESASVIPLAVVDADGPLAAQLNTASMENVLASQETNANRVAISFQLTRDQDSGAYVVHEVSCGAETA